MSDQSNPSTTHQAATALYGRDVYDATPKAVFAAVAYFLADLCSESGAGNGEALGCFMEEVKVLSAPENDVIDPQQARRVMAAIKKATKELKQ